MFAAGLHPLCGDNPKVLIEVNLGPFSADCFARPRAGQDGKLQRVSGHTMLSTKITHERRHVAVRNSIVVNDRRDLCFRRQKLLQMASPAGWIIP